MKIRNIIFTAGFLNGDNYLMEYVKEWRGDILVEFENDKFYELTFITIQRLIREIKDKNYCTEEYGWIVVEYLTLDTIFKVVSVLEKQGYFNTQKEIKNLEKEETWTVINFMNYDLSKYRDLG